MKKVLAILLASLLFMVPAVSANEIPAGEQNAPNVNSTESETMQPYVAFQPDRCIVVKRVISSHPDFGFKIEAMGGKIWSLDFSKKVGIKSNVKAGSSIDMMVGPNGQVYGWKVL